MYKIIFLFLLFAAGQSHAQKKSITFPRSFTGHWKGKLNWVRTGKPTQQFTMQLKIRPSANEGQYEWHISYGDSSRDERPYLLKPADDLHSDHWVIDERNGIILDNYVAGNCLQGSFTVLNNTIVNNYCIENGQMNVQFFAIKLGDKKTSGKGTDESPTVDSYRMTGYQYGMLEKVE